MSDQSLYPVFEIPNEIEDLETEEEVNYGSSLFFDFVAGDFVLNGGQLVLLEGHEAWIDWCIKAAKTARGAFLAYSDEYGVDLDGALSNSSSELVQTELEAEIIDALEADARTSRVYGFEFEQRADALSVRFTVEPAIGSSEEIVIRYEGLF